MVDELRATLKASGFEERKVSPSDTRLFGLVTRTIVPSWAIACEEVALIALT
jgi:hypothetical protein